LRPYDATRFSSEATVTSATNTNSMVSVRRASTRAVGPEFTIQDRSFMMMSSASIASNAMSATVMAVNFRVIDEYRVRSGSRPLLTALRKTWSSRSRLRSIAANRPSVVQAMTSLTPLSNGNP